MDNNINLNKCSLFSNFDQSILSYDNRNISDSGCYNEICTDSSKQNFRVGCALVVYKNSIEIDNFNIIFINYQCNFKYSLIDDATIFMAKLFVINNKCVPIKLCSILKEYGANEAYSIITDSNTGKFNISIRKQIIYK